MTQNNPEARNSSLEVKRLLERGQTPILPFEQGLLHDELAHLGVQQSELGKLLGEAMDQSSETWHDNAPADAINHQSHMLSGRAEKVIASLGSAVILGYPDAGDKEITLGSIIGVAYPGEAAVEHFLLTGICRTLPILKPKAQIPEDLDVITAQSPLGNAVLGQLAGSAVSYTGGQGRSLEVRIETVQQFDQRLLG